MTAAAILSLLLGAIFGLGLLLGAILKHGGAAAEPPRRSVIPDSGERAYRYYQRTDVRT